MKHVKSERLKKLESELTDLEQWLKLGLVPKKDVERHKEEILAVKAKIEEEKDRLQFLKESGEVEEYITPKKQPGRSNYTEMPTIPDIDMADTMHGSGDTAFDMDSQSMSYDSSSTSEEREEDEETAADADDDDEEDEEKDEDEESYFSEKNRWRRGSGIIDPDANEW